MPSDSADIEAQVYRETGFARKLKTPRQYEQPHPSKGGFGSIFGYRINTLIDVGRYCTIFGYRINTLIDLDRYWDT